jgi:hypothetical protein
VASAEVVSLGSLNRMPKSLAGTASSGPHRGPAVRRVDRIGRGVSDAAVRVLLTTGPRH